MSDLNRQTAEAQGWEVSPDKIFWTIPEEDECYEILHAIDEYTPSTDLNQAMAFAEWAAQKHNWLFDVTYANEWNDDDVNTFLWHVAVADETQTYAMVLGNALAEALCKAVLEAIGKEGP